ncbi:lysosomal acid phosphatase-like [Musca vetustissima]|uniref:lysosomal acid phosphatase-like n=1 Tax=Musca vetustissima TaxID=27455 RepID=UPI002AB7F2A6|nr:lysosomal acid phosphatase-like [Musca vetustissima]
MLIFAIYTLIISYTVSFQLFRHGPRTPVNTYPNDPYINETFFPYGWGHLTNDAKKELFKIGNALAKRYQCLLQPFYNPDLIYAQSSASPRTLMSMATVLAGMLPPVNTPMEWNFKLNWQPIPILSIPEELDIWLRMKVPCPRYDQALNEVLQFSKIQQEIGEYHNMFQELTNITGLNITTAADITSLYITLLAEQSYGLDLPAWTTAYYPERMQFLAEKSYIYNAYTTEMQRLKGGPFLQKIFEQMLAKANDTLQPEERKMFVYCAHDWTITNVLLALKVWKRQMPRFSALISFELHQNLETEEYFVEIYFQNDPKLEPVPLTVPGCSFQCPLNKLLELIQDVMPNAIYEEMCQLK